MKRKILVSAVLSVLLLVALAANVNATEVKITASDGAADDLFGGSVAISGDYAVVGAHYDDDAGSDSGSAYIFKRDGTAWTEQTKITASDAAGGYFGYSVAISGDYAVVGAYGDDDAGYDSGSAYIFWYNGTAWTEQAKITASDGAAHDDFGTSVAISADYAVVGAWEDDDAGSGSGSAYIFKRYGTEWTEQAKITASDSAAGDYFGRSVAISCDYAVVGACLDDGAGLNSGSAYIFKRYGTEWTEQAKITASDSAAGDWFGKSVAISGDYAVVGAYGDDDAGSGSGSAYIYDIPIGILFSCDSDGNLMNRFAPGETVYVTGTNLIASTGYKLWIQDEVVSVGDTLATGEDPSGVQESVTTDASGTLPVTAIWEIDPDAAVTHTEYDIVADNQATGVLGTYHATSDLLDSASTAGFVAPVPGTYVFTTADAVIALQIAVGSRPPDLRYDVSGDKRVTSLDALMILRAAAGKVDLS